MDPLTQTSPQAPVEFFAARNDARTIQAGLGRFGRKAGRVNEAQARYNNTARRWNEWRLPGPETPDETVRAAATAAAVRAARVEIADHDNQADREEQTADSLDWRIAGRDRAGQSAIAINERNAAQREALQAATQKARATIAAARAARTQHTQTMTPQQVAAADQARNTLLNDQARQRQLAQAARQARQARETYEQSQAPTINRGGPSLSP